MSLELLNDYYVPGPVLNIFLILSQLIVIAICEIGSFPTTQINQLRQEDTYTCMIHCISV